MPVTFHDRIRRLGVPVVGLLSAAAVCVACSSTTGGTAASPPAAGGSSSVGIGSLPAAPSVSVPESILPSASGLPSIAAGGSPFCRDFNASALSKLGSSSDASTAIALWDKLAADAPDEIKDDVQAVDDYLHAAVSGNIKGVDTQKLSTAAQHIGTYFATHCSSS